ncbi:Uncharacterized protein PECH_007274 [Penicillium ucsense]|uniref:Fe2OG dioxygenase domain-containing protein n=1 Tax=Penicillium ucsense TaxID=2839758 RepID=A0A8J8WH11_9EURO|nr:Uncharacterized protein PECM_007149 [Penicillium ucsense]KAF7735000.1 Uncharacterized protein PECH_007274 [Penicillium ucsense]
MAFFLSGKFPTIQTRKALLLIDFQNEFVRPTGNLHVPNTAEILDILPPLVAAFRQSGDVIWVRSQYESPQPQEDWNFGDKIILATKPRKPARRAPSDVIEVASDRDTPEPVDAEAFLSDHAPKCCIGQSAGFQFPAPVLSAIDPGRDTVLDKTGYSALESAGLALSFRTRFITELYLCGSLSNISVYATALDAVRNGFSVTLVEDCLGFRDFRRHQEAMRRMADILGASGITSQELCQELDWQETEEIAQQERKSRPDKSSITPGDAVGIEDIMHSLDVMQEDTAPVHRDDRALQPSSHLRSPGVTLRSCSLGSETASKPQIRARVRRPKRRELTPDMVTEGPVMKKPTQETLGEGDCRLIPEIDLSRDAFERIRREVSWQKMYHLSGQVPRLVAVQGQVQEDGSIPIYRHPADESPLLTAFTPAVDEARILVERILGHPLNHVLIQLYRDGHDSISEHSDKTLDIVRGSFICNVSLGAQRVMTLRTKVSAAQAHERTESSRQKQAVPLPHRSLFILGEKTNMRWLHGIRPDKRAASTKTPAEQAFGGERISLTFRHIGTYLHPETNTIWGQGAVSKSSQSARPVIHGDAAETERLVHAFGQENRATDFDWNQYYGAGFDVVNFVTTSPAPLILSGDPISDLRVQLALGESGIRYGVVDSAEVPACDHSVEQRPCFVESSGQKIAGDLAILKFLAQQPLETTRTGVAVLQGGGQLDSIEGLLVRWRHHCATSSGRSFESELEECERALAERHYLGGASLSIADCSFWPILRDIMSREGPLNAQFVNLQQYHARMEKRGVVRVILG